MPNRFSRWVSKKVKAGSKKSLPDNNSTSNAHSPAVQGEPSQERAAPSKDGKAAIKITGAVVAVHHQPMLGKMATLEDNSGILKDICRLLQAVKDDKQRVEELLIIIRKGVDEQPKQMQNGENGQLKEIRDGVDEQLKDRKDKQLRLDTLQVLANVPDIPTWLRSSILQAIIHLSLQSDSLPQGLMINNVEKLEDESADGGGSADLWRGKIRENVVGLKYPRVFKRSKLQNLWKDYLREALVWQQLEHPNVLPFIGVFFTNEKTRLCLVSPWMENGNLNDYLETAPYKTVDHYLLVHDVASGLAYLHQNNIFHSDLKGDNVLITKEKRACLADFGGSKVVGSQVINPLSMKSTSTTITTRYTAPELLESQKELQPNKSSDMYAFAGVCYDIFARKRPFHEYPDRLVEDVIRSGQPPYPSRPDTAFLTDGMWEIMTDCWRRKSTKLPTVPELVPATPEPPADFERPEASQVVTRVKNLGRFKTEFTRAPKWNMSSYNQILEDVKHPVLDAEGLDHLWENLRSLAEKHGVTRTEVKPLVEPRTQSRFSGLWRY